ncbi:DUF1579 domain-containing protein [Flavobacterium beibuense]|uniref:DUF1579 domain-containing protein n=1 Tax=Flavobacterium beibuense TaxID=657326 RepID=UPI003A930E44
MKKIFITLSAVALCFASCKKEEKMDSGEPMMNDTVPTEEPVPMVQMDSASMAKAWETYMTPSEPHKMMADEEGKWNNEMTFWMGPDMPGEKYTSGCEVKMILGGRYQQSTYSGEMMGMPFEGISTVAYNNATGEFTSTWIDNMGTGLMVVNGKYDPNSKSTTMTGTTVNPATKQNIAVREVYTFVDENTRKMEMFETPEGGKEYQSMEIIMTRK